MDKRGIGTALMAVLLLVGVGLAPAAAARTGSSVSTPVVTVAPSAAAGARSGYTILFKVSATGALSGGGTVTVSFPAGTDLHALSTAVVTDTTTAKQVGGAFSSTTTTLTFGIYSGSVVNAGDTLSAAANGAVNPATAGATYTVTVSTTSDTTAVASSHYSIVAGHSVSTPAVTVAPSAAAGARSGYTIVFNASATGALSGTVGSTVSIGFPAGTDLHALSTAVVTDTTTAKQVGGAFSSTTTTLTFGIYSGSVVNAGDTLSAAANGAVNPATAGATYTVTVSTTSDTTAVASSHYSIVAGHSVSTPAVTVAPSAAAGARSGYTIVFNASATGALSGTVGSTVSIGFPAGTDLHALSTAVVTDTTTAKQVGGAFSSTTTTLTFGIYSGSVVNAGDTLSAAANGAVNPATAGATYTVTVSTTSDTTAVASSHYSIVAGHSVSTPAVTVAPSAAAGARSGYTIVFNASATGALSGTVGSTVSIGFPAGTDLHALSTAVVTDTTTAKQVGGAFSSTTTTLTFGIYSGSVVNAGDTLSAAANGAVNPATAGATYTVTVSTTSDTTAVASSHYSIVAGRSVSMPIATPSDHTPAATGVSYTVVFATSATGALSGTVGSTVSISFPAGTDLRALSTAVVTDTTTAKQVGGAFSSTTTTLTFGIYAGSAVNAGDTLSAAVNGAVNPATASSTYTVKVSSTSDTTQATSCPYYIGSGPAAPCVTKVTPNSGPAAGGSTVKIVGLNFAGATAVKFGTAAATGVVVNPTGTSITATSPAGTGTVDVTVITPAGTSPITSSDHFTYIRPPKVTTTSLPPGSVGVAYSASLTASGGKKPYTWSVVVGSLPPGLSIAPNGVISGMPTTAGTFNFTVQVTDSENPSVNATKALSITVS